MLNSHHDHHHLDNLVASGDVFQWIGFAAIFSYSFLLSFHCIGMCGPLACSLLNKSTLRPWLSTLLYNLGRCVSYTIAGALAGFLAEQLSEVAPLVSKLLSALLGAFICIFAFMQIFGLKFAHLPTPLRRFSSNFQRVIQKVHPAIYPFVFGLMTLFLPCMTLHPLLFMSAAHQNPTHGAATMFVFFLGTAPAMLSATYMPLLTARLPTIKKLRLLGYLFLIFAGLTTIWRAFFHG